MPCLNIVIKTKTADLQVTVNVYGNRQEDQKSQTNDVNIWRVMDVMQRFAKQFEEEQTKLQASSEKILSIQRFYYANSASITCFFYSQSLLEDKGKIFINGIQTAIANANLGSEGIECKIEVMPAENESSRSSVADPSYSHRQTSSTSSTKLAWAEKLPDGEQIFSPRDDGQLFSSRSFFRREREAKLPNSARCPEQKDSAPQPYQCCRVM